MKLTVMIVDDVFINVEILKEILSTEYKVITAESGEDATKLMVESQPDIVLLDISMPGMDGFDVQQYMKDHETLNAIPIIFVTGALDFEAEERGLTLGAVDYIRKPFNADIVKIKVRNHLELKTYRDHLEDLVRERTKQLEKRTVQLAASREAIIMGMSLMSECHDKITGEHINRIKILTRIMANELADTHPDMIDPALAELATIYSPLHDLGKVGISDTILNKSGGLTPEEFEIMKSHTTEGAELLRKTEEYLSDSGGNLQVAIGIAECHHERFDGTGYPHALKGEAIPISARIVSLVDVYDALRSPRTYKKSLTHEEAYHIITKGDGRTMPQHFDPRILETFIQLQPAFRKIYIS